MAASLCHLALVDYACGGYDAALARLSAARELHGALSSSDRGWPIGSDRSERADRRSPVGGGWSEVDDLVGKTGAAASRADREAALVCGRGDGGDSRDSRDGRDGRDGELELGRLFVNTGLVYHARGELCEAMTSFEEACRHLAWASWHGLAGLA